MPRIEVDSLNFFGVNATAFGIQHWVCGMLHHLMRNEVVAIGDLKIWALETTLRDLNGATEASRVYGAAPSTTLRPAPQFETPLQRTRQSRLCIASVSATSAARIPGSVIEWPALLMTMNFASGQARWRSHAERIGQTTS